MLRDHLDPFGRLLESPALLTREERVDVLRQLSGRLQGSPDRGEQWLGERLQAWLREGGDYARILGIKPRAGSRRTAARLIQQERAGALLRRLANELGVSRAVCVLHGEEPCPGAQADVVQQLRDLDAPASASAFARARKSVT